MIPQLPLDQSTSLSPDVIAQHVDRSMTWIDQYNQHMQLTVQALRRLQMAFEAKFSQ